MLKKKIKRLVALLKTKFLYNFGSVGKRAVVYKPIQIDSPCNVELGDFSTIYDFCWLIVSNKKGKIVIGDHSVIGHFAHIVAESKVTIENHVLVADKVFISDCTHNYENVNIPILAQGISVKKSIVIGEGSWLGENVCVCGASIGKHCIIGANSVVTNDIPNYSVAVGAPAKVIKKYDFSTKKWIYSINKT